MRKITLVAGVLVVVAIAVWWWRHGKTSTNDTPATPGLTQGSSMPVAKAVPVTQAALIVRIGTSTRSTSTPLAHARVRIAPEQGEVIVLETNDDGVVNAKLAPGEYRVSASAPDHEPAGESFKLASTETRTLALTLVRGGRTLSGLVSDVSGGPIGGARIDAAKLGSMARPSPAIATAITGADGRYTMTVAEGQLMVAARSPDYAAQSRYVDVGAAGATADFSLVPGGVIEGVVLDDRSKQPAPAAQVFAKRDSPSILLAEGGGRTVTAGPDGRFRISGLRPGAYELHGHLEGRRTKSPTLVGLGVAEQVTDVQLLISKNPIVRGTVTDEANGPIANAMVRSMNDDPDQVRTDAKGAFVLDGLGAGRHVLFASVDTHMLAAPASIEIADKDVDGVVIKMKKAGRLRGHVEPRQVGCAIALESAESSGPRMMMMASAAVTTPADGGFELAVLPGKLELSARCNSGDQGTLAVQWTTTSLEVVLAVTPGASIAGKVVDGDDKPVPGATVMATAIGPTLRTTIVNGVVTSGIQGVTSAGGNYDLRGMQPGTYRVTAMERGHPMRSRKEAPSVTLAAAEHKTGVDLAVDRPTGVIKGVVTGTDGKPLPDAWVSVHQDLGAMLDGAMGARRPGPNPGGPPHRR